MTPALLRSQAVRWCESLHVAVAQADRSGFTATLTRVKSLLELPIHTDPATSSSVEADVFEAYERSTSRVLALATIEEAARAFGDGWDLERVRSIEELVAASFGR